MPIDLSVQNVSKSFGNFTAVDSIGFSVECGHFFSILGPSGCGKTTLLRMIAGLAEPDSGTIDIRGRSMLGIPPNKRPVNLIFQNLALFPMMNVGENIAVLCADAIVRGDQRAAVIDSLTDSGRELLFLSFEQLEAFAGNMLELRAADGAHVVAMSQRAWDSLDPEQQARFEANGRVVTAAIDDIEDSAGGSVRCMLAEIHLPRLPTTA